MVLRKNSCTDLPELMGSLVIPSFTYRPVIEPGMEIPVTYQSGKYSRHGDYRVVRFDIDGFVPGTILSFEL
jgi:hypothetical protein